MSTQALTLQAPPSQGQGTYFSIVLGKWKNRVFHLLTTGQGANIEFCPVVCILSFVGGGLVATVIDRRFPNLEKHRRAILNARVLIPALVGVHLVVLACGVHITVVAFMASAVIGFVIGSKVMNHHFEKRNAEFRPTVESINAWRVKTRLKTLDLTGKQLTGQQLQKMADDGDLEGIERLFLCMNPDISAKKLLEVIGKRCPHLVWLDIGYNKQFTGRYLKEWVTPEGFPSLRVLELRETNLTKKDLEYMIAQPWVQKLEGINLSFNKGLDFPPDNVLLLTNLKGNPPDPRSGLGGGTSPFNGDGIFIDTFSGDHVQKTPEFIQLMKAGKLNTPLSG